MATPVVNNIIHSGAILWNAPVAEASPDESSVAFGGAWGGNWVRVGYTKAPLTLAYESEEADINVEEELAPVKRFRIGENLTVETVLAEFTAEYLQKAAGNQDTISETAAGASQDAYEETGLGGDSTITERKWGFEARFIETDGTAQPIRFFVHIATAMINGNLEFSSKADDYPGIPIQIKALTDESQSAGQKLVLFQRVTAEATS
jgi:hypothetical protein